MPNTVKITIFEIWSIAPNGLKSRRRYWYEEEDWQVALKKKKLLENKGHEEVRIIEREVEAEIEE